jgi:hypothetical protein
MSVLNLNLPSDIPWRRRCVSQDMLAEHPCGDDLPPKWRSSIAVYDYEPDPETQRFPGRKVVYFKITCSITGYVEGGSEIEGRLAWRDVDEVKVAEIERLLDLYHPCSGALLQVSVGLPAGDPRGADGPYIMDFQPKRRELYTLVSETGERASRSLETLAVRKGGSTTESLEVLDVDQGYAVGVSGSVGAGEGIGVGGSYNYSRQGQWGTKALGAEERNRLETTDRSREQREVYSHTTQLSQLYSLLDSYHAGTNRAVFLLQPRPFTSELHTGFVRGPRALDGVQEFFFAVSVPAEAEEVCVSAALDTAHVLQRFDHDHDLKDAIATCGPITAELPARDAEEGTTQAGDDVIETSSRLVWHEAFPDESFVKGHYYRCITRTVTREVRWTPSGNNYDGYELAPDFGVSGVELIPSGSRGVYSATAAGDEHAVILRCTATSSVCYHERTIKKPKPKGTKGYVVLANPPASINAVHGTAAVRARVFLRSLERTVPREQPITNLMITSRGVCCCSARPLPPWLKGAVDVVELDVPSDTLVFEEAPEVPEIDREALAQAADAATGEGSEPGFRPGVATRRGKKRHAKGMTRSTANEIVSSLAEALRSRVRRPGTAAAASLIESVLGVELVADIVRADPQGWRELRSQARHKAAPLAAVAAKLLGIDEDAVTVAEVLDLPDAEITRASGLSVPDVTRAKLTMLGVVVQRPSDEPGGDGSESEHTPRSSK